MKVGDYVRTESYNNIPSKIGRIRNVEFYKGEIKYIFIDNDEDKNRCYDMSSIRGMSSNIIDLIEVEDYVNGNRVDFTNSNNRLSYEDKCIGFYDGDGDITLFEKDIKSIVTKEQFEAMEYKLN